MAFEKLGVAIEISEIQRKIDSLTIRQNELKLSILWPKTNFEILKAMPIDELAEFLDNNRKQAYDDMRADRDIYYKSHKEGWKSWLEEAAEALAKEDTANDK